MRIKGSAVAAVVLLVTLVLGVNQACAAEGFEIKKEQRIAGEASFVSAKLRSEVGDKVEYLVTVRNFGNTTLKLSPLKDSRCVGVSPSGETTLEAGESETFLCTHVLEAGSENPYHNAAAISAGGVEKVSNTVEVEFKPSSGEHPNFEVFTEQRLKGTAAYTTARLQGEVGKTVEYKITVKDTGNTTMTFAALKDPKCTKIRPPGETVLRAGESESFTCKHVLVAGDAPIYTNVAVAKGGEKEKETLPVEVEVNSGGGGGGKAKTTTYKYCASRTQPQQIGPSEVKFKPCMKVTDAYNGVSAYSISIQRPANSKKTGGCPSYLVHLFSILVCEVTDQGSHTSGTGVTDYVNMKLEWIESPPLVGSSITDIERDTMTLSVTTSAQGKHEASGAVTFVSKEIRTTD